MDTDGNDAVDNQVFVDKWLVRLRRKKEMWGSNPGPGNGFGVFKRVYGFDNVGISTFTQKYIKTNQQE